MNRQLAIRTDDCWGDTSSREGIGRRIYVTNFPSHASAGQICRFLAGQYYEESIEGFRRLRKMAFIQFKQPTQFTAAIMKNESSFLNRPIKIEPYKEPKKPSKRPTRKTASPDVIPRRCRSRTRSRSRSRSRGYSPDDSYRRGSRRHSNHKSRDTNEAQARPEVVVKPLTDIWGRNVEVPGSHQQMPSFTLAPSSFNFSQNEQKLSFTTAPSFPNQQMSSSNPVQSNFKLQEPNSTQPSDNAGDIPENINLTLKLLLMQKTAKRLSIPQLQDLINFFEAEKISIQHNLRDEQNAISSDHATKFQENNDNKTSGATNEKDPPKPVSVTKSSPSQTAEASSNTQEGDEDEDQGDDEVFQINDEETKKKVQKAANVLWDIFS